MKEYINITNEMMKLHDDEVIEKICREIDEELKGGIPKALEKQVSEIMKLAENRMDNQKQC